MDTPRIFRASGYVFQWIVQVLSYFKVEHNFHDKANQRGRTAENIRKYCDVACLSLVDQ
jgi:hypothetical protein